MFKILINIKFTSLVTRSEILPKFAKIFKWTPLLKNSYKIEVTYGSYIWAKSGPLIPL